MYSQKKHHKKKRDMDFVKYYEITLKGLSSLIMNSDRLCDPLDPDKKRLSSITSLKKKNDEHILEMERIGWEGRLCYDEELGIYIPTKWLRGCIKSGAKRNKKGMDTVGLIFEEAFGIPLMGYEKFTPEKLWNLKNKKGNRLHCFRESVVIDKKRIMSCRPIFSEWKIKFKTQLHTDIFSFDDFQQALYSAGIRSGIGDLRPQKATGSYGRFMIEEIKEIEGK